MDGRSLNPIEEKLKHLREVFPEAISEGKVDVERLKQTLGEEVFVSGERYHLSWAGKSDAFKAIQTPTTATLKPQKDQSVDFDTTQNIFIEGENLEVLKVLQKSYYGKIKMIYIDPPYNTGNDSFIYPDKFSETKEEYLKRIGDKDEAGYLTKEGFFRKNSRENGQFHSNWLSMMYPRLFLARNLLREDGVIFVSIDDNEVHNLRLIMNEIFGEENFIACLVWEKKRKGAFLSEKITNVKEYILVFSKNEEEFGGLVGQINSEPETYPCINASNRRERRIIPSGITSKFRKLDYSLPKGSRISVETMDLILHSDLVIQDGILKEPLEMEGNWRYSQELMNEFARSGDLYITEDLYLRRIVREPRHKAMKDLLPRVGDVDEATFELNDLFKDGWGSNEDGNEELREIMGGKEMYSYPKPSKLIKKLLASARDQEAVILDFFAGSGTTAHAVFSLNNRDLGKRRFILVQLPENITEDSEAAKAGYKTIADICKERIRRVGKEINQTAHSNPDLFKDRPLDLGFKVFALEPSNFKMWRTDIVESEDDLKKQIDVFQNPVRKKADADAMAWEILLKSGYELTTPLERTEIAGVPVYSIANGEVILALEMISQKAIDEMIARKPKRVVCLDSLFAGNDQLKTNTVLQMKDRGVEFKTI